MRARGPEGRVRRARDSAGGWFAGRAAAAVVQTSVRRGLPHGVGQTEPEETTWSRRNSLPSDKTVVCLCFKSAGERTLARVIRMAPMLRNALENKGFSSCSAGGACFPWGKIAAVGSGDGDSAGAAGTYGDAPRQEADQ